MKPNELRIGNWIKEKDGRLIHIHDGFGIDHYEQFEPIPITPEILKQAGFDFIPDWDYPDRSKDDAFVKIPYIISETNNNVYGLSWYIAGIFASTPTELIYLHQLQNLYFALTNEELQINLNEKAAIKNPGN